MRTPAAPAEVVVALGAPLLDHPHLEDVEINPLRLTADGLVALDAVLIEETRGHTDR
ncbi:MAG: hypothetical protein QOF00_2184 [Pseudonocardiales bacterium]|nr:hypothetical protein [Pseudonocardiales bacterium]